MKLAAGLPSHTTATAISSGSPKHPMDSCATICFDDSRVVVPRHLDRHRGLDHSGADRINEDALRGIFKGSAPRQAYHRVLARRIRAALWTAYHASDRGTIRDRPASPRHLSFDEVRPSCNSTRRAN